MFQRNFSGNRGYFAWASWHLGVVYGELKDFNKAKALLHEALSYSENEYGREHVEIGLILQALARVYYLEGDLDKTKELAEQAIKILENHHHASLYESFETLAEVYLANASKARKSGNIDGFLANESQAKEALQAALAAVRAHFSEDSPFIPKIKDKMHRLNVL